MKHWLSLCWIILLLVGCSDRPEAPGARYRLADFLGGGEAAGDAAYRRADPAYRPRFPADHQAHPAFRSEWWYLNGNLQAEQNPDERYGFQFTIFRQALAPQAAGDNPWLEPQFYMGHLAISLLDEQRHLSAERFVRAGPGLAGTAVAPLRVWLDHWTLAAATPQALFPARLDAWDRHCQCGYRLQIRSLKPLLLQGEGGYSPKRAEAGFASHYYSFTRLEVRGELLLSQRRIPVRGSAWYDHEWASNTLADYQSGWDWFSLQLDDGRELMFIRLRSKDPQRPDFDQVTLVGADGERQPLRPEEVALETLGWWQAPSGRRYPSGWRLKVARLGLDLAIQPRSPAQEMVHTVTYWEGAVQVQGSHPGQGYVELTGY